MIIDCQIARLIEEVYRFVPLILESPSAPEFANLDRFGAVKSGRAIGDSITSSGLRARFVLQLMINRGPSPPWCDETPIASSCLPRFTLSWDPVFGP